MNDVETVVKTIKEKMDKAVAHVKSELANVRTSRASSALVERITVDYYGSPTPLRQLASFQIPEARTLVITPFDKNSISAIEKAIQASDIGITPSNDGHVIRLNFPMLTEERRKELVKLVKQLAEEGRVSIRNLRRQARHELESLKKDGLISDNELESVEKQMDKITHEKTAEIDQLFAQKERELLDV
jgi:ribosome recycling factor